MSRARKQLGVLLFASACQGEIDGSNGPFLCPEAVAQGRADVRCFQNSSSTAGPSAGDAMMPDPPPGAADCPEATVLIRTRCALTGGCHGDFILPDLSGDFEDGRLFDQVGPFCSPRPFIDTGDAAESAILQKIQSSTPCDGRGTTMPPPNNALGAEPLDDDEVRCIEAWITAQVNSR